MKMEDGEDEEKCEEEGRSVCSVEVNKGHPFPRAIKESARITGIFFLYKSGWRNPFKGEKGYFAVFRPKQVAGNLVVLLTRSIDVQSNLANMKFW